MLKTHINFCIPKFIDFIQLYIYLDIVKKNCEPLPSLEFTHISPPCLSTIFLHMDKPIPVPG